MAKIFINKFSGLNAYNHPTAIADSESPVFENYILGLYGKAGKPTKRDGFGRYSSVITSGKTIGTLFEAGFSAGDKLLANKEDGASSQLYECASAYTGAWTAITNADGLNHNYRLSMAMLKNKVYIANRAGGGAGNKVYDGIDAAVGVLDMGCPPCNNYGITATPESAGTKEYKYWITFLYDGFQESGVLQRGNTYGVVATSCAAIIVSAGVTLAVIPTGNSRCTARKIYRTKENDATQAYYVATIFDNASVTYVDRQPDASLGDAINPVVFSDLGKPYISKYLGSHKDRLFEANLTENLYKPLVETTEITLTASDTGGGLGSGVYKYKIFKGWLVNDSGFALMKVGQVLNKTIDMGALGFTGTDNSVVIAQNGTAITGDGWYNFIVILRTKSGGNDYYAYQQYAPGTFTALLPFTDVVADTALVSPTIVIPELDNSQTTYPSWIAFSDASKPDLFPSGNVIKIGENDGDQITNIFSEDDAIVVFKYKSIHRIFTHAQSSDFWRATPVVETVGADPFSAVKAGHSYVWTKASTVGTARLNVWEWYGSGEPRICSLKIQKYIQDSRITTVRDIVYDSYRNWVWILTANTASINTAILIYDLNERDETGFGAWYIFINSTTDLNFRSLVATKSYGVLIGTGAGYVDYQVPAQYQDSIGTTPTNTVITSKIRFKTIDADGDLILKRFRAKLETTSVPTSKTMALKYTSDDIGEQSKTVDLTDAITIQRISNKDFTGNSQNATARRQTYLELQDANTHGHTLHQVRIDYEVEHEDSGGKG